MDIETRKNFNKLKHYLTLFNNAYFDKDHMSTEQYQDLFYNIWLFHDNQIWVLANSEIGEYYLDPKWENLWI